MGERVIEKRCGLDSGLLLAVLLGLAAALPFLVRPGLPRDTDAELHVFRAAEILSCWQGGVLYPRWAPDFYYGYGYPIFNYYAPLTYHLAALFSLCPGVDIVGGVKAVFVLGLILSGAGAYLLARDVLGDPPAAVVAAASFLFAPYVLFVDPHARGDLAEHFAIGLLPLALFATRRWVEQGRRAPFVGSVLFCAALILSHNLLGVVGFAILLAAIFWQVVVEGRRDGVGRGLVTPLLALALGAVFWLPMLVELPLVQLTVVGAGHFDFRNHFVALAELLAPSRVLDLGSVAPRYWFNLGLPQWVLALVGVVGGMGWLGRSRRALAFFALSALGLVALILPLSLPLWEAIPPLAYLQFPWRLLGPAALMAALLAGAAASLLPNTSWRPLALAAGLALTLALSLPLLFPPEWGADFGDTTPAGIVRFELEGKVVGTTSTGDFLPRTVETMLRPQGSLVASYESGWIDKANHAAVPEGTTVKVVDHGPVHDRFSVSAPRRFVFRLYTLAFPGWTAWVDDEPVDIELGRPEGFITLWVPPGEHDVLVRFVDTPVRRAAWGISVAALIALLAALGVAPWTGERQASPRLSRRMLVWLGGALLLFLLFKLALVDPLGWFRYTSPPGEAWAAQYRQQANLAGEVELLGFDLPGRQVRPGEMLDVVLYWRAVHPLETNYQSFVHLAQPLTVAWGQSDALNPGGLPTTRWPQDRYVWDAHRFQVPANTPPGEYVLAVGLYTLADGRRLPVLGAEEQDSVVLEIPVTVLPGR
ncbi:MAG: hypothetical protein JW900_09795 [Anaerolineae bacterium]|nr:hypothetical protein [Anaerolineae bacterium]